MSSQKRRNLLVVFITLLIVFETIVYVTTTPPAVEQFFQLYALGANRIAANYYPNGDPNIHPGESVRWYVGVENFMGSVQLVAIRVKLGNQSLSPPDDLKGIPSSAPIVAEFKQYIQDNTTWEIPFIWQISNISSIGSLTRILQLQINNETYQLPDVSAFNGNNFRLIFELWTWSETATSFQFGWFAGTELRVAWLQIWFDAIG